MRIKLKGSSLVEMLVAMVIFSTAIIALTTLNAGSYKMIKDNEISDLSNKLMIRSVEYFYSPTQDIQDQLTAWLSSQNTVYVGIDHKMDDASNIEIGELTKFDYSLFPLTACEAVGDTDARRIKYLDSNDPNSNLVLCNEIEIQKKNEGFYIVSRVRYKLSDGERTNELKGYRPFSYSEQFDQ